MATRIVMGTQPMAAKQTSRAIRTIAVPATKYASPTFAQGAFASGTAFLAQSAERTRNAATPASTFFQMTPTVVGAVSSVARLPTE
jgi:hypothetical protein